MSEYSKYKLGVRLNYVINAPIYLYLSFLEAIGFIFRIVSLSIKSRLRLYILDKNVRRPKKFKGIDIVILQHLSNCSYILTDGITTYHKGDVDTILSLQITNEDDFNEVMALQNRSHAIIDYYLNNSYDYNDIEPLIRSLKVFAENRTLSISKDDVNNFLNKLKTSTPHKWNVDS